MSKLSVGMFIIKSILIVIIIFLILNIIIIKKVKFKAIKNKLLNSNYVKNLQLLIENIENISEFKFGLFNPIIISIFSIIISIIVFIYFLKKYNMIEFSILLFLITMILPIFLLEIINLVLKKNMNTSFSLYIVSLQSFARNTNDVISALDNTKALKPLNRYIEEFIKLINIGFSTNEAFDNLIDKLKSKEISKFFYLLKLCYINGSNLYEVINQFNDYYNDVEKLKKIQFEKRNNYLTTMFVLLIMNVFLLFFVVLGNENYSELILYNLIGRVIIDINIFIYLLVLILVIKLIRMEE